MDWLNNLTLGAGAAAQASNGNGSALPANFLNDVTTKIDQNNRLLAQLIQAIQDLSPIATGSFTMDAASSKVISNGAVASSSLVIPVPANAAAGTLMKAHGYYVTTATGSFTIATGDGSAAAGTETFNWGAFTTL